MKAGSILVQARETSYQVSGGAEQLAGIMCFDKIPMPLRLVMIAELSQ